MSERRPDPDKMLARMREEEVKHRGKLKIYLGAAPGVGKTHTMLQDAIEKREHGLDVIAGIVESHGRKEIDAMLHKVDILPRRIVEYHNKPLLEFDLDAALKRAPSLLLIDEMAHTNVPGLRHAKRWQDIKELLDRGIDVYTTLNVQHIESLNDVVTQISGIKVRETVPDSLIEMADTIELVDLSPDDLLRRLQDGKVYIPAQAQLATQHFFRKGNLTALRELALRFTAERVDAQVLSQRRGQGVEQTWPTRERLLVCVGFHPRSMKVIRRARRMAVALHAEWIVVHVESPRVKLNEQQRADAIQNLRLAEKLGAETRILNGLDISKEIINFAREKNVSKIVIGKQARARWKDSLFGSLVNDIVNKSGDIDVFIIRGNETDVPVSKNISLKNEKIPWKKYGIAFVAIVIATGLNLVIAPYAGVANLVLIFILAVLAVAMLGEMGPAIFASIFSAVLFTFLFTPSNNYFDMGDFKYIFTLVLMSLVGTLISNLTILNSKQAEIAHLGEQRTASLHALTRQLATARGMDKLLEVAMRYIADVFDSDVQTLLTENGLLSIRAGMPRKKVLNPKDQGVAQWVYDLGQIAGLGTDTLPFSDAVYVPLLGSQGPMGVIKITPRDAEQLLIPEQLHLLEACVNQLALALEVDRLQERAKESQIAIETERLRAALFNSLSHELQNPLAVIVRMLDTFSDTHQTPDPQLTRELVDDISQEAERLNKLISNLLQITQLQEGKIKLSKQPHALQEVIAKAMQRIDKKLNGKPCKIQLPNNLPLVSFDEVLIEQVLVNLLENAIIYTPLDTSIEISASVAEDDIMISVADRGAGLMMEDVSKVFEEFYRGETPGHEGGAGLGLSVCQSIIKAHGGRIWAENRWNGGAIFYFVLPLHDSIEN
jgi:two-component system sensor histidine kinase KdpD